MSIIRLRYSIAVLALAAMQGNLLAGPLFESNDTLAVTITAPMKDLLRHRKSDDKYNAVLSYTDAAGVENRINFILKTRGKSRLDVCGFPPLRLTFDRDDPGLDVFEGQRHVKMVNQCDRGYKARDWLLLEYGIYRAYNTITDHSFRVRRLDVTFRDTESAKWKRVQPAFLIESVGEAADRLQRTSIQPPQINSGQYSVVETTHNVLFQYLIANTDFSVRRGPSGEGCCHNGKVLSEPGEKGNWVILPYDFDQAGVINTEYALPHDRLPIRRVTDRLYRGFCWQNTMLLQSAALFNEHRRDITEALLPSGLGNRNKTRALNFIDRFFDIVNDPQDWKRKILERCRNVS